ncbi:MAG: UDP-N-acetylmuramoyl-L-alanyl-D-glutamate--2,6-diaminopimelate ligase [Wenzhouxiangella sp.]|nr:MAG: UDP-N-acetylmuramoyl-L-alanyl-D-glutamate--2,6-diaminopimelate ligase [Wenzhouxiangella sp.]
MSERKRRTRLADLLHGLTDTGAHADLAVRGLAMDSRCLRPGDLFVALAGASGHGFDHLEAALAAGAVAVLCESQDQAPAGGAMPVIGVPELRKRLPELARRLWGDPAQMDLLAVTGTNGKTSVAWLLAQALDGAMIGTLGVGRPGEQISTGLTTPDVLSVYRALAELREVGIRTVVLEASSHALDQERLAGLSFSTVIFTTLGHDHLDYHGDLDHYAAAKARLFGDYASQRQLINRDDAFGARLAERLSGSPGLVTYGCDGRASLDVTGRLGAIARTGLSGEVQLPDSLIAVRSRLLGRINFMNLLVVVAELDARGFDAREIQRRVEALLPVPGRMQALAGGRVVIDYAHTPDALENVLTSLREVTPGELWCVFGCGGDRDRAKRPLMGRIAEALADRIVLTDDNPRNENSLAIIREIQAGMRHPNRCQVVADRAQAIARAIRSAAAEDVVLVAGKGHEIEQVIGDRRLPFSDEQAVREALEVAA